MTTNLTNEQRASDFKEIMRHLAEEINVKRVIINGVTVYNEPLLRDKYKEKYQQFDEIYSDNRNEYLEEKGE